MGGRRKGLISAGMGRIQGLMKATVGEACGHQEQMLTLANTRW